ncbi:MAG: hypothetical protein Q7T50_03240 [Candidatus Magasanikbacteria bacterium]|nr:hypothetical protein [Candidatus Magasanikbacteria bacterium]
MEIYINRAISYRIAKATNIILIVIMVFEFLMFPAPVLAKEMDKSTDMKDIIKLSFTIKEKDSQFINKLPENENKQVKWSGTFAVSAYNSEVAQCDDSPCITANGYNLCENGIEDSIATNMLPFGTKVRFPDVFGDRVFVVRDRMNKRYTERFDVWMINHDDAIKFGLKYTKVEILY